MSCPFESESDSYNGIHHSSTMISLGFNSYEVCLYCVGRLIEHIGEALKNNAFIPNLGRY